jgi:hypothetical protein
VFLRARQSSRIHRQSKKRWCIDGLGALHLCGGLGFPGVRQRSHHWASKDWYTIALFEADVEEQLDLRLVLVTIPEGANIIIGQTHFIKTVEDLYGIVVATVPLARFGIALNEASGACQVRTETNDDDLRTAAVETARRRDSARSMQPQLGPARSTFCTWR